MTDGVLFFETGGSKMVSRLKMQIMIWLLLIWKKYKGFGFQTEFYARNLSKFDADGPFPISS